MDNQCISKRLILVCNMFGNLVGDAGWSDRATPWDRKVRCVEGLQNIHLCVLVDSSGEISSVLIRESNIED
jgi:hypothetical protein